MITYQEQWAIPEEIQAKQVTVVAGDMEFAGAIEERANSRGQLKKKWNFHRSVHKKHCGWLGGNQNFFWLFGLVCMIHVPAPKIFSKFPEIFGADRTRSGLI